MSTLDFHVTLFGRNHRLSEVVSNVSSDIFTGQIITTIIIVVFLAVFLLREWIVQNARPGVFGDPVGLDGILGEGVEGEDENQPLQQQPEPIVVPDALQNVVQVEELQAPEILPLPILAEPVEGAAAPLPFPLIETRTDTINGSAATAKEHVVDISELQTRTPSPSVSQFADHQAEREYIRRQREHYFRMASNTSSEVSAASSSLPLESPGAGPSRWAPDRMPRSVASSLSSGTEPSMVALPPSPPSSDTGSASQSFSRKRKSRIPQSKF